MTDAASFRGVVRSGRRCGSRTLVVHLATPDPGGEGRPRVGFVVGRSVGGAVIRNRVRRRLRHLVREHLDQLPDSAALVVRALPAAAESSASELDADLRRCLGRAQGRRWS